MSDFVHRLSLTLSGIELVGEVKNIGVRFANISVAMNNTGGDNDGDGIRFSNEKGLVPGGVSGAIFPESEFILAVNEAEKVGLIDVLVRAPGDAWMGDADVAHGGEGALGDFVGAKEFGEVATRIVVASERFDDDADGQSFRH